MKIKASGTLGIRNDQESLNFEGVYGGEHSLGKTSTDCQETDPSSFENGMSDGSVLSPLSDRCRSPNMQQNKSSH